MSRTYAQICETRNTCENYWKDDGSITLKWILDIKAKDAKQVELIEDTVLWMAFIMAVHKGEASIANFKLHMVLGMFVILRCLLTHPLHSFWEQWLLCDITVWNRNG
jgi:hypothetical protein